MKKIILIYLVMFICSFAADSTKTENLLSEAVYNANIDEVVKYSEIVKDEGVNTTSVRQSEVFELAAKYSELMILNEEKEIVKKIISDKKNNKMQEKVNVEKLVEIREILDGKLIGKLGNFLRLIEGNRENLSKNDIKLDLRAKKEYLKFEDKKNYNFGDLNQITIENIDKSLDLKKRANFVKILYLTTEGKEKNTKDFTKSGNIDKEYFILEMTKGVCSALENLRTELDLQNSDDVKIKFFEETVNKTLLILNKEVEITLKNRKIRLKDENEKLIDKISKYKIKKEQSRQSKVVSNKVSVKIAINNDKIMENEKTFLSIKVENIAENDDIDSYKIVGIDNFEILDTEVKRSQNGFVRLFHIKAISTGNIKLKCIFIANREAFESEEIGVLIYK